MLAPKPTPMPLAHKRKPWEIRMEELELKIWLHSVNRRTLFTDGASKGNPGAAGGGVEFSSLRMDLWILGSLGGLVMTQTIWLKPWFYGKG